MNYQKITESEWQVMRVLWKESPLSSAEIIQEISLVNHWSNTTIKTFLSRLVDKFVVGYHQTGRKRFYYPLVTEMDCVRNEMKSTIHMIYGGQLHLSTHNFAFFGDNDMDFINQLGLTIESDYQSLSERFHFAFKDKQSIYIHSSQSRLFSALGLHSAPAWVRVGLVWDIMHLAPKECFTDRDPNKLLHHILANLVISNINRMIPYWLIEGVSAYESKWVTKEVIQKIILENKTIIDELEFQDFSQNYRVFRESNGQELACTFIEFIVDKFGYDLLNDFIRNPNEIKRIFNMNSQNLLDLWKTHLYKEYLGGNV